MSKKGFIIFVSILLFTFLRKYLVIFSPIVLIVIAYLFRVKLTKNILFIILLTFIFSVISFFKNGFFAANFIISLLLFLFPIIVLLSRAKYQFFELDYWFSLSSKVLLFVNFSAVINFLFVLISGQGLLDDGFNGLYGRSGLSMHTLALVNFIYTSYFFVHKNFKTGIIFFLSAILCFYGLGTLIFIFTILVVLVLNLNKRYFKYLIASPVLIVIVFSLLVKIKPTAVRYLNENIDRAVYSFTIHNNKFDDEMDRVDRYLTTKTPRKILAFRSYFEKITESKLNTLFGIGPGTYNSRASFLLNGEYTKNPIFKKITSEPPLAVKFIYPLWNSKITYQYNDGTRNEPFSSLLSMLTEYGLVITLMLIYLLFKLYQRILKVDNHNKFFIQFVFLFFALNLILENYVEYPEFFLLLILIIKPLECYGKTNADNNIIKKT